MKTRPPSYFITIMCLELAISSSLHHNPFVMELKNARQFYMGTPPPTKWKAMATFRSRSPSERHRAKELAQLPPLFQHLAVSSNIPPGDLYILEVLAQ